MSKADWLQTLSFPFFAGLEYTKVEKIDWSSLDGKNVLDYGCGNGRDAYQFLRHCNCKVYGTDILPMITDIAKDNLKKMGFGEDMVKFFYIRESDKLPFDNEFFDLINCNGVLHHIENPDSIVAELYRVLKKDGVMYIMLYTEKLFCYHWLQVVNYMNKGYSLTEAFGIVTDNCDYTIFYTLGNAKKLFRDFEIVSCKEYYNGFFRLYKLKKVG